MGPQVRFGEDIWFRGLYRSLEIFPQVRFRKRYEKT